MTEKEYGYIDTGKYVEGLRAEIEQLTEINSLRLHENIRLRAACEMIVAVKHCMMFLHIHDERSAKEVCAKYGAQDVQQLARQAEEAAEATLQPKEWRFETGAGWHKEDEK